MRSFLALALCRHFTARHPPRSAVLHEYDGDVADFIASFPCLAQMNYLADIARLEWARLCAFHADGQCCKIAARAGLMRCCRIIRRVQNFATCFTLIDGRNLLDRYQVPFPMLLKTIFTAFRTPTFQIFFG